MAKILIADDDNIFSAIIESTLTHEGHIVQTVDNGAEALEYLEHSPCDVIICDGMMPSVDGVELIQTLQAKPETSALNIIVASSRRDMPEIIEARGLRIDAFLLKPFNLADLIASVRRVETERN